MSKAFIKAISYYLPEKVLTNEQLSELFPEWSVDKIASKVGISERHIAAENETACDMGIKAAMRLFEEHSITPESIDFIIFCSQSPDYHLPSSACIIQERLCITTACGAFDMNLGCSGYEYGLAVAKGLIVSGSAKNILLITAETYTKYIHPKDKGNRTIFGDGATATLVSDSGYAEILDFSLGTNGKGADRLILRTSGARKPEKTSHVAFDEAGNHIGDDYLFMDGKAIFDFTADAVPEMVEDVLKKNFMTMDDISLVVFHQANKYMINYLRKLLEIPKDKFYIYMDKVGNTVSSTVPIALCEASKENLLRGNVLIAGFGVGFSWGATILRFSPLS